MLANYIKSSFKFNSKLVLYIGILLIVILIILFSFRVVKEYERIKQFKENKSLSDFLLTNKQSHKITSGDVNYIQPWMTFKYINFIFDLPDLYLKDRLKIDDPHYPNLSLGMYSRHKKLDKTTFTQEVKKAINDYLNLYPIKNE